MFGQVFITFSNHLDFNHNVRIISPSRAKYRYEHSAYYLRFTSMVILKMNFDIMQSIYAKFTSMLNFQMEFNNAVKENNQHSLRHGSKKANMEKNQNPRIIPCETLINYQMYN